MLARDAEHFPARNNLAAAYMNGGDFDRAVIELERALAADRNQPASHRNLTTAHLAKLSSLTDKQCPEADACRREARRSWSEYEALRAGGVWTGQEEKLKVEVAKLASGS